MTTLVRLAAIAALLSFSSAAHAQTCTPPTGWRAPLIYFCADQPARASQVNGNFGQVVAWLEAKVGQVGQPLALAPNSVSTASLADGSVTAAKLAPAAVVTAALADGAVTAAKVKGGGVVVYSLNSSCPAAGALSLASTCQYLSAQCGNCALNLQYQTCTGTCPPCQHLAPQSCTASNTLRGYLVAP